MIQFRVYLRSELGKLSDLSEAESFLRSVSHDVLKTCGLTKVATKLIEALGSQENVDRFVARLGEDELTSLTKTCDHDWRKNHVYDKLVKARTWQEAEIPIDSIDVQQAEWELGSLFERNGFRLSRVIADPALATFEPYKSSHVGSVVEFPICMAIQVNRRYRLFDGIHRAIQMARNGSQTIRVLYATE